MIVTQMGAWGDLTYLAWDVRAFPLWKGLCVWD